MFKNKKNTTYQTPRIERIVLDNEISLQLDSTPPVGPGGEIVMKTPEYFGIDPFRTSKG